MTDNPKVNANRAQWTDRGLCPNPTCCVGHRGDCGRIECAWRPRNYQPPEMLPSTIPGSPVTVEVSACRGNNSDLVPSSIADPKTIRMQGKVAC